MGVLSMAVLALIGLLNKYLCSHLRMFEQTCTKIKSIIYKSINIYIGATH
jgi:hypothetical protein